MADFKNLKPLQKEILQGILDDSYAILALDGDTSKATERALKVLPIKEMKELYGEAKSTLKKEVHFVLSLLKESCQNRHGGMSRELLERVHISKYLWAKYVCANFSVPTMGGLDRLSKNVWGNRLPDKYREELSTHLSSHPSLFSDTDDLLKDIIGEVVPNPPCTNHPLWDTLSELHADTFTEDEDTCSEERVHIQIGGVKITLAKGSKLSLKEVISDSFSVKGCVVTVGEVDRGVLKDVLIQS